MDKDTTAAPSPADTAAPPAASPAPAEAQSGGDLQTRVVEVLKTCFDPEIPVNIYELGLIYSSQIDPPGVVSVRRTGASPA
jgi:metal-sulfur cluster biosynthetic enzyme